VKRAAKKVGPSRKTQWIARWAADNAALVLNGTECRLERYGQCGGPPFILLNPQTRSSVRA
jgi:hypothetical protein